MFLLFILQLNHTAGSELSDSGFTACPPTLCSTVTWMTNLGRTESHKILIAIIWAIHLGRKSDCWFRLDHKTGNWTTLSWQILKYTIYKPQSS